MARASNARQEKIIFASQRQQGDGVFHEVTGALVNRLAAEVDAALAERARRMEKYCDRGLANLRFGKNKMKRFKL